MNKLSCKNKGFIACYLQHNWFFVVSTTVFILLLIASFSADSCTQVSVQDKTIAQYITAYSLLK
ncbi:hypothetical protein K9K77_03475 [Candidatus Babeliales bacterium]|nr:hypothetical protein [Candidatus Babeliales bacterium]